MLDHVREAHYRGDDGAYSDDPLLTVAYWISGQAITFLGPTFWMLLAYLFVVDEFGH
jgi:hypothetical protein